VLAEQNVFVRFPTLMAQQINLRDEINVMAAAGGDELFDVGQGQGAFLGQFGMALKLVVIIDAKDKGVDTARAELFVDEIEEAREFLGAGRGDAKTTNGKARRCRGGGGVFGAEELPGGEGHGQE